MWTMQRNTKPRKFYTAHFGAHGAEPWKTHDTLAAAQAEVSYCKRHGYPVDIYVGIPPWA